MLLIMDCSCFGCRPALHCPLKLRESGGPPNLNKGLRFLPVDAVASEPAAPRGLPAPDLPHHESAVGRRLLDRVPRARRRRPAGGDQGVSAELARAAARG